MVIVPVIYIYILQGGDNIAEDSSSLNHRKRLYTKISYYYRHVPFVELID